MITAATRSTLHENVLKQLCAAIESGQWESGSRLPGELGLARQFKVSRNCIREVMKVLANRGIVRAKPGSGTFLSENAKALLYFAKSDKYIFDKVNLKELIEARCLVEGQIAYYAAKRGGESDFAGLESLLYETENLDVSHEMHVKFHERLAEISGNKLLKRLLKSIQNEISVQREQYKELHTAGLKNLMYSHSELLKYLKAHDPKGARKAMVNHIVAVWSTIFGVPLDI